MGEFGFLYRGIPGVDGQMINLDAWLDASNAPEGAKWTICYPLDISDTSWITGNALYDDGPGGLSDGFRAFLLDASSLLVIPEPSSLMLLTLAIPALIHYSRPHRG